MREEIVILLELAVVCDFMMELTNIDYLRILAKQRFSANNAFSLRDCRT